MSQRKNKNGIPILDPEANHLPKPRRCMPGEHEWHYVETTAEGDWLSGYDVEHYECVNCPERDTRIKGEY